MGIIIPSIRYTLYLSLTLTHSYSVPIPIEWISDVILLKANKICTARSRARTILCIRVVQFCCNSTCSLGDPFSVHLTPLPPSWVEPMGPFFSQLQIWWLGKDDHALNSKWWRAWESTAELCKIILSKIRTTLLCTTHSVIWLLFSVYFVVMR